MLFILIGDKMSNKAKVPKHYNARSPEEVKKEYDQLCFQLGAEVALVERSERNQDALKERIANLEGEFQIATQHAQNAAKQKAKQTEASPSQDVPSTESGAV